MKERKSAEVVRKEQNPGWRGVDTMVNRAAQCCHPIILNCKLKNKGWSGMDTEIICKIRRNGLKR
jgi:hypothetical protein